MAQARRINSVKELNGSTGCGWLINVKLCKLWDHHLFKNWNRVESLKCFLWIQIITCTAGFDENAKIDVLQPHPKSGTIDDVITWHKITIEELSTITTPRSNYALIATIEALDPDFGWYYIGCRKCHKFVKEEAVPIDVVEIEGKTSSKKSRSQIPSKTVFRCETEGCPKPITTASPRYKMRLDVEDGTSGSCTFVMFDDCIRLLMNKSCEQIRETIPPGTPNNQIPEELYQLVGRLIFKFEATDYVIETGSTVYKCTKIIEDPILIKKFENVVCPVEIEDDNSITNLDTSDVTISQYVSSNIPKVTGSSSVGTGYDQDDEPITPVSSIQKRKVVEIDVDDQEHQASTNKKHLLTSKLRDCFSGYVPKKIKLVTPVGKFEVLTSEAANGEIVMFGNNLLKFANEVQIGPWCRVHFYYNGTDNIICMPFGYDGTQSVPYKPYTPFGVQCIFKLKPHTADYFTVVPAEFINVLTMPNTSVVTVEFGEEEYNFEWFTNEHGSGFSGVMWLIFIIGHHFTLKNTFLLAYKYETTFVLDVFYENNFDVYAPGRPWNSSSSS
ncbi:OLC1v1023965C1 [Oldenlandia corymbosa var. corymbosa]|uniref:OLC1v1023965C1 n=1 Tax=Oldenlandia corymbosa var. corymbosa TaxID=529605 RepID=A0AAV1C161_OLDCO|nr:OLC1v1023965C1 [Oldenlandia corymbosa var. corymbosa]